jgi:hypothetical protein
MSLPRKHVDWQAYDAHKAAKGTDADFARSLGIDPRNFPQYKKSRHKDEPTIIDVPVETVELAPTSNGNPTTTLQRVELVGEPVTPETGAALRSPAQTSHDLTDLAARVASLEAHRLEVDARLATLQAQSLDTAQPHAALRSAEMRSLAQTYAESTHTWDDPEDAKSIPFNLSLPRGLKRLLDAEAKRTGFPASRLVQRLLMAALVGQEVGGHA